MDTSSRFDAGDGRRRRLPRFDRRAARSLAVVIALVAVTPAVAGAAQNQEPPASCAECHEAKQVEGQLAASVHAGFGCLDCHPGAETVPHPSDLPNPAEAAACRTCHDDVATTYTHHGAGTVGSNPDIPTCVQCHGGHEVRAATDPASTTNPANLPDTCGVCHSNIDIVNRYLLQQRAVDVYRRSVHGPHAGKPPAAGCIDCHGTDGDAHRILPPSDGDSRINRLAIATTCGRCHSDVKQAYLEGIHGLLAERGETDVPVCTDCHGEHGIIPPSDPDSPVSKTKVAEQTCARCHDSEVLNQRYDLPGHRLVSFLDSYHGLKSAAGDTRVANCASCHGAHRILPASDPTSRVNPANLRSTCGTCHPGISRQMAAIPIHRANGEGLTTRPGRIVQAIYKVVIAVVIGLMVIHWLFDLGRHLGDLFRSGPQVRRMRTSEVWQHTVLMISFTLLAVTGFALIYDTSWWSELLFGWKGGFDLRGVLHRVAAVVFMGGVVWHFAFAVLSRRGATFVRDMRPGFDDAVHLWQRLAFNLRRRHEPPREGRFTYVEKAEYWALVWGAVVMTISGLLMWGDNWFSQFLPKGVLDVARAIHFWEAWLAVLAILVWHLYATVFSPDIYPMNPSWLTGKMPEWMYRREHPASDPEWDPEPEPDSEVDAGDGGDGHSDEPGADAGGDHNPPQG